MARSGTIDARCGHRATAGFRNRTDTTFQRFPHRVSLALVPRRLSRRRHPCIGSLVEAVRNIRSIQADDELEHPKMNTSLGAAAALMGCIVSSLASVYFEKILKDAFSPISLWVRNVQLAFYSMFPALFIGVFYIDGVRIAHNGFFAGYNWAVWTTLGLQAIGGMVVSLCVNYADNIAKTFAMSISILISLCISVWFFEFKMTRNVRLKAAPNDRCRSCRLTLHCSLSWALALYYSLHISTTSVNEDQGQRHFGFMNMKKPSLIPNQPGAEARR